QLQADDLLFCDLEADPPNVQVHWFWRPLQQPLITPNHVPDTATATASSRTTMAAGTVGVQRANDHQWPFIDGGEAASANGWHWLVSEPGKPAMEDQNLDLQKNSERQFRIRSRLQYQLAQQTSSLAELQCWANNTIGQQKQPCSIQLLRARGPDAPGNCSLANATRDALTLACQPGYSGGLSQRFHLEVYELVDKQQQQQHKDSSWNQLDKTKKKSAD